LQIDGPDPKWRFFWRIGEQPPTTQFPRLNADPVVPEGKKMFPSHSTPWMDLMYQATKHDHLFVDTLVLSIHPS
jgi:hypothetical protein